MINKESYMFFLKTNISAELLADDIKIEIHDEFHYDETADVNITVKILTGQVQCGVIQYPAELLIEANERFTREIIEALNKFAINFNETIVEFGSYKYKQFYSTPTVIGTFQDKGLVRNTAISISVSLISYVDVLGINRITLEDANGMEEIKPISFVLSYLVETNSTGALSDPITKSIGETTANSYSVTMVPRGGGVFTTILALITIGSNPNEKFKLTLYFESGSGSTTKFTLPVIIQSANFSQQSNGLPLLQLTFVRSEN